MKNKELRNRIIIMVILLIITIIFISLPNIQVENIKTSIEKFFISFLNLHILIEYILPIINTILLFGIFLRLKNN